MENEEIKTEEVEMPAEAVVETEAESASEVVEEVVS